MSNYVKIAPFTPGEHASVTLSVSSTTGNVAVAAAGAYHSMLVYNAGATDCFIECGNTNGVTASSTTSMPIKAGTSRLLAYSAYVAAITASSTTTIWVTPGDGGSGVI